MHWYVPVSLVKRVMSEKDLATSPNDTWVIEVFTEGVGWSLSFLNQEAESHSMEWCLQQWNDARPGIGRDSAIRAAVRGVGHAARANYRLRNVTTGDTLMGAVL
jgi:hypothetical protein